MIDRLELLVPENTPAVSEIWRAHRTRPAKSGSPYQFTTDVRDELAISIHHGHRTPVPRGKRHYKVDFTDTRLMSVHDFLWRICSIFQISHERALGLRVARIDLTADVSGTPVEWFRKHCRVQRKQRASSYETIESETKKGITTITFGRRPDLYRIYNKVAEKQSRKQEILYLGMLAGDPLPVVTRIERQCSSTKVPLQLAKLGQVFDNAAEFDPFSNLVIEIGNAEPATDDWTPQRWLMNLGLAVALDRYGDAYVRSKLNRTGNAHRIFSKYSELIGTGGSGPTRERLVKVYQASTTRQLNRPSRGPDGEVIYPAGGLVLTL